VKRTEALYGDQYRHQVEHISEAILNGDPHLDHDLENTLANMRALDACMKSMDREKKIVLD